MWVMEMAVKQRGLACGLMMLIFSGSSLVYGTTAGELDGLMGQWLNLEKQKNAVLAHWQEQQPILQQRIELLKIQAQKLTDENQKQDLKNQKLLLDIAKQTKSLQVQRDTKKHMQTWLNTTELTLKEMQLKLPPPLQNTLNSFDNEVPLENASSLVVQFNRQLAAIEAITLFNQKISIYESVILLSDGSSMLTSQLYFGLPYAWFTNADGSVSGFGRVQDGAWLWEVDANADPVEIKRAVAIATNQLPVSEVSLPVYLKGVLGE